MPSSNRHEQPPIDVLQSAIEQTGVVLIFAGPDRKVMWVNQAFTDVSGYTLSDVKGFMLRELPLAEPMMGNIIDGKLIDQIGKQEVRSTGQIRHKDGNIIDIDFWFRRIFDDDGTQQGFLVSAFDITKLRRTEHRLQAFMDNATSGIVVQNHEGKIIECNPAAEKMLGLTRDQMMGRTSRDPHWAAVKEDGTPAEEEDHPIMRTLKTGEPVSGEVMGIRLPSGEYRWLTINTRAFPNVDDGKRNATASFADITAQKRQNELLQQANIEIDAARRRAEEGMRAKATFLANMSHEIRTPMNGIIGMLHLLQESTLDGTQAEWAQIASASANDLLQLINDILDYSRLESGGLQINAQPIDPAGELNRIMRLLGSMAREKDIDLKSTIIGTHLPFNGDPIRLGQILMNLIGNAIKFTDKGHVDVTMKLIPTEAGTVLHARVTDTGVGIPESVWPTLFDRFTQAENQSDRHYQGSGLGLAICKELVGLMDGSIGFESTEGVGTTFWFEVPSAAIAEQRPLHRVAG